MNIKGLFYHGRINIAKCFMLCCIFLFGFLFCSFKVNALSFDILSSTYAGNGNDNAAVEISFDTVVGENTITENVKYIQGSGISNEDGITFEMNDIYANIITPVLNQIQYYGLCLTNQNHTLILL